MNATLLGKINKQKTQNDSVRPADVKDNELISLYMTSKKSGSFVGYFQVPAEFIEAVIPQLAIANIIAVVADSEEKSERIVPTF